MTDLYECHLTTERNLSVSKLDYITPLLSEEKWKTSEIARDPVLGNNIFFYFTTYDNNFERMMLRMKRMEGKLLSIGVPTIRSKIEHIVYDTATKKTHIGIDNES